jgi:hypothetical protein
MYALALRHMQKPIKSEKTNPSLLFDAPHTTRLYDMADGDTGDVDRGSESGLRFGRGWDLSRPTKIELGVIIHILLVYSSLPDLGR